MSSHQRAVLHLCDQVFRHAQRLGKPMPFLEQVTQTPCEDGLSIMVEWYMADGFHAIACYEMDPGGPERAKRTVFP